MAPIKVRGRIGTAYDTARILGVSRSRAKKIIERARELTGRFVRHDSVSHDSGTGQFSTSGQTRRKAPAATKRSRRNAHAETKKANSKNLKARR